MICSPDQVIIPKKSKGGRKSIRLSKSMIKDVQSMISQGYLEKQVYHSLGVSNNTWYKWKGRNSELVNAIAAGHRVAIIDVEDKLRQLAMGEQVQKEKIEMLNQEGEVFSTILKEKRPGPDFPAIRFILTNCYPEKYRDNDNTDIQVTMIQAPLIEKTDGKGKKQIKEINRITDENAMQPASERLPIAIGRKRTSRAVQSDTVQLSNGVKMLKAPADRPTGPYKRKNEIIIEKKSPNGGGGGTGATRPTR